MSRWKAWGVSVGAVLLLGGALVMKACGYGEEHARGPGDEQVTWFDNLTNTLDSFPSDCAAVGPSCSGSVDAAASEMASLDAAVLSWDDADRYEAIHEDAASAQDASDQYDALRCMSMPYADPDSYKCLDLVHQSLDALNDAHERLVHGGENPLAGEHSSGKG
jgi:hypothetical protein